MAKDKKGIFLNLFNMCRNTASNQTLQQVK